MRGIRGVKKGRNKIFLTLATAAMLTFPNISKADIFYGWIFPSSSTTKRTRWCPYTHSLISGDLKYSPYADKKINSGMIPGNVRYSTYAFSPSHPTGLVWDDGREGIGDELLYKPKVHNQKPVYKPAPKETYVKKALSAEEKRKKMEEARARTQKEIARRKSRREKDAANTIYEYLRAERKNFRTSHGMNVSNNTIGTHFMFPDQKLIVKYTNPGEAEKLGGFKLDLYEKHKKNSSEFCKKYQELGWKIYLIESGDKEEIKNRLENIIH